MRRAWRFFCWWVKQIARYPVQREVAPVSTTTPPMPVRINVGQSCYARCPNCRAHRMILQTRDPDSERPYCKYYYECQWCGEEYWDYTRDTNYDLRRLP